MRRFLTLSLVCSLAVFGSFTTGCGGPNAASKPNGVAPKADHGHEDHDHPSEGPHHGHLIELGQEEYHAELTHDDATKTVTVYLLDDHAKGAVAIADPEVVLNLVANSKPLQVKLAAAPQEGDAEGQASRFSVVDEAVLEALEAPKTTGRLSVSIGGKSYTGSIEHKEHGAHKH